jgi:hypothetical protein
LPSFSLVAVRFSLSRFEVVKIALPCYLFSPKILRPMTYHSRLSTLSSLFCSILFHCSADQFPILSTNPNCFGKIQEQKQFPPPSTLSTCLQNSHSRVTFYIYSLLRIRFNRIPNFEHEIGAEKNKKKRKRISPLVTMNSRTTQVRCIPNGCFYCWHSSNLSIRIIRIKIFWASASSAHPRNPR